MTAFQLLFFLLLVMGFAAAAGYAVGRSHGLQRARRRGRGRYASRRPLPASLGTVAGPSPD